MNESKCEACAITSNLAKERKSLISAARRSKVILGLLCVVLLASIGLNTAQFIEFRQNGEAFMAQLNRDIGDAYRRLDSFINGADHSPEFLHEFAMQLSVIHSLLSSNDYIFYTELSSAFFPDLRLTGRFISGGGSMNSHIFSGDFPGVFTDGVVSENEIMFLEAVRERLGFLADNTCGDIRLLNETIENFTTEWQALPFNLLAAG